MAEKKGDPTKNRSDKRQQQILNAAMTVFLKKGFSGSTTKEIAKEAGVAEGTIFRYFKTKKDLLLELATPGIVQSLTDTLEGMSEESDEVILKAILKNRMEMLNKNSGLVQLLIAEARFHPELREQFVERIILKAAAVLERFMKERVSRGDYRVIDPGILTRMLVGMIGVFVFWRDFLVADKYVSFDNEIVIDSVVEIFLNGVRIKEEVGDGDENKA